MTYLASIYACLLALFGALLVWALPMVVYAAIGSFNTWHRERLERRRARLPASAGGTVLPAFRAGLPEASVP